MSKGLIIILLLGGSAFLYTGNHIYKGVTMQSNEVNALSGLKQWQMAVSVAMNEIGQYPSSEEIFGDDNRFLGMLDEDVANAWDGHSDPIPYNGYYFSSLEEDEDSESKFRVGLCAYPVKPGSTGNAMILLLLDDSKMSFDEETGQPIGRDDSFQIWRGNFTDYGEPVREWLSKEDLNQYFKRVDKSVKEGMKEAQEAFDKAKRDGIVR
ncbi:MAG: hypothetical protein COA79_03540 [Planctomycetota bacterium]|nr:MAG: hypothetical protein COA79_03540 [Planctomycetota bacterium]